ncbi:hypothetical protein AUEXF2481DRAFT_529183 [Aureobasidium subglaciale EXF-2481]|uniref:Uncharacterized protein n=1 Tax=Aureobasidium subglaciale (strain EXF-2481) TaxID=1043005 RepID=A0A074XZG1_AURSE|nr:uncharacterized protein AUEXF2481DRAFT_529183 [Aureobasidium subglaciale EXF-2481]KEQ90850.1 hypothetical protein AUEXF2481DRAFT_529183 [Aureobasidium subglaciale EXF-2481]
MSLLENDSGDDGEFRHRRFDYPAPSLAGIIDFFVTEKGITDVQVGILLNQTPQEVQQLKKQIRFCLRAPCPWSTSQDLVDSDGTTLSPKEKQPPGWITPAGRQGELFRHLVMSSIAEQYAGLFVEPDITTQIKEVQLNVYGRFTHTPFVIRREVLTRLIESCAQAMRTHPSLRHAETESQHISTPPKLKRCRLEGVELGEASEMPDPKRPMIQPFGFAAVQTIATLLPSISTVTKSESVATPTKKSVVDPIKVFNPSRDSHRCLSSASELIEQERAVFTRYQMDQPASSPASTGMTPRRNTDDSSNSSTSSTACDDRSAANAMYHRRSLTARNTAESQASPRRGRSRDHDRVSYNDKSDTVAVIEGRRLRISSVPRRVMRCNFSLASRSVTYPRQRVPVVFTIRMPISPIGSKQSAR